MNPKDPLEKTEGNSVPLCLVCGQRHLPEENHIYTYTEDVDDDLICHICLQPLLQPLDTPCGHTYCTICLTDFLVEKDFCPMDRKALALQRCRKSSILVNKLLDKLTVNCPFTEHCSEILQRCNLEHHFQNGCKGASHYGFSKERRRCSPAGPADLNAALTVSALGSELSAAATIALMTDEPGLINPAFNANFEDIPPGTNSTNLYTSQQPRTTAPQFERSTVRSRSFKKINRALNILRRTKSGSAVANHVEQERENIENLIASEADGEMTSIKINRRNPQEALAIRVVGGSETPLIHIIIQHIYRDGVIFRDGRLLPGDMILKVNGIDIRNVPHSYALFVLSQPCQLLRLTVLREQRYQCGNSGLFPVVPCHRDENLHIILNKSNPEQQLGIKLIRKADEDGVFVFNLLEGGLAAREGELRENDKVLAINGHDLQHGSPESAAQLIQASKKQVHFSISRQTRRQTPDILQETGWGCHDNHQSFITDKSALHAVTCHEKVIVVRKDNAESLGMTVAGGPSSHREWNLPIYVLSVEPGGVISRDGRIKTGDILLSVNGIDLTGVSRGEAVAHLKNVSSSVVFKALELKVCENAEGENGDLLPDANLRPSSQREWSTSWVMWLELPRSLYSCKEIVLRRNTAGTLGFSIVGGYEENSGNRPFFIKSIVEGTPAYNDGRIRCGDILLAVNGRNISGMAHTSLARMLKELRGKLTLTIVSWPGTFL
ncbi:E3 ubiquitin-protein ligase LNX isoform X2 [Erythrolamprus reginae]|uniref:E3 ubiquitin-protein ligase LNX isoform X2 n=1 Tax=Erythrolamprus reginae TaxID=121349 RepID=UPI00396C4E4B